jgi:GxxExxY protein
MIAAVEKTFSPQRTQRTQRMDENELSNKIVGAAIEVHRTLGPGLLESTYEECLCHELSLNQIPFERQVIMPVVYKGNRLECGYRADIVVDNKVILELKSVADVQPIHKAQLLTYLKLSGLKLGLLLNFNAVLMKDGIKRFVKDL